MKLETPLIAILFAVVIFGGLYSIITVLGDNMGASYNLNNYMTQGNQTNLVNALSSVNKTREQMNNLSEDFLDLEGEDKSSLWDFFGFAWKIGKQIFGSLSITKDMLYIISEIIGLPLIVVGAFVSILLIVFMIKVIMILVGGVNK